MLSDEDQQRVCDDVVIWPRAVAQRNQEALALLDAMFNEQCRRHSPHLLDLRICCEQSAARGAVHGRGAADLELVQLTDGFDRRGGIR